MDLVDLIWTGNYLYRYPCKITSQEKIKEFGQHGSEALRQKIVAEYFERIQQFHNVQVIQKSEQVSLGLRRKGNELYKAKNFDEALRAYNLSLCFSPTNSVEYYQSIANRSALLFQQRKFHECKRDLLLVVQSSVDDLSVLQLKDKLKSRLERCLKELEDREDNWNERKSVPVIFCLTNPNPVIPSAENFVKVENSVSRGRHVTTTKYVPPGTVLVVEDPFAKVLLHKLRWDVSHCHSCFSHVVNGIPCDFCTFEIFCCAECHNSSRDRYMCQISSYLHSLMPSRTLLLATKIITEQGPEKLYEYSLRLPSIPHEEPLGFTNGVYRSDDYHSIFNLIYHKATPAELFQYMLEAHAVTEALWKYSDFFSAHQSSPEFKPFVCYLIARHLQNLPPNAHSINELASLDLVEYGAGAYSLLSMINHSCDPNVTRFNLPNGRVAVVAIKSIDSSELLDNYGVHYAVNCRTERQKHLNDNYNFLCDCEACKLDWPLFDVLKSSAATTKVDLPDDLVRPYQNMCAIFDDLFDKVIKGQSIAIEDLIECLKFFQANFKLPFFKLNEAQETFKHYVNSSVTRYYHDQMK